MKTKVEFLGQDKFGTIICEVQNSFATATIEYDVKSRDVVYEFTGSDIPFNFTQSEDPLTSQDKRIIEDWFESVLN